MATLINQFTWIPIYQELAQELARWENRQEELVSFLEELRSEGYVITPLHDKDADGARFVLREIDPFTFFGVFNRRIGYDQRLGILSQIKQRQEVPYMEYRNTDMRCGDPFRLGLYPISSHSQ